MRLAVAVAALVLSAGRAAAQDPSQVGTGARGSGPSDGAEAKRPVSPAAGALARALLPEEQWNRILDRYAASLTGQVSEALTRGGEMVPDSLGARVRSELGERLPYVETVDAQAQALAKEFTPDELKRATDFYSSALGKKVLLRLPDAQTAVADRLQERLAIAVPEIVQRLAPKAIPKPGADVAPKPPPAQGRRPPATGPSGAKP
jgi:hypothetical protein